MTFYSVKNTHDTAANWTSNDPTLLVGEFGYETDTGKLKVGDGSTAWTSLSYVVTGTNTGDQDLSTYATIVDPTFTGDIDVGAIEFVEDSGLVTGMDMPVSDATSDGDAMGIAFSINSTPILMVRSSADGNGGVDELQVVNYGNIKGLEKSADPVEPAEGEYVIWMSDGTGKGDDGDVLIASQAGGTTNYSILFDHSAGSSW